jgi:hypothetical protein
MLLEKVMLTGIACSGLFQPRLNFEKDLCGRHAELSTLVDWWAVQNRVLMIVPDMNGQHILDISTNRPSSMISKTPKGQLCLNMTSSRESINGKSTQTKPSYSDSADTIVSSRLLPSLNSAISRLPFSSLSIMRKIFLTRFSGVSSSSGSWTMDPTLPAKCQSASSLLSGRRILPSCILLPQSGASLHS